jgi:phosphoribosylformimino-5-aminoimidazole carboxamide ribotide isomerase
VTDALSVVEKLGGQEVIFTDVTRDGTLEGANVQAVANMMKQTTMNIYASGGVTTLEDIQNLKDMHCPGCIVGKAIYDEKLNLAKAIRLASL